MAQTFKYVSSVEGQLVTRFPSLRAPQAQFVGATRVGNVITWNPKEVVAISDAEWQRYRREYNQAIADGSLKKRTEEEYKAWLGVRAEENKATKAKADEAKAKAEARNDLEPSAPTGHDWPQPEPDSAKPPKGNKK